MNARRGEQIIEGLEDLKLEIKAALCERLRQAVRDNNLEEVDKAIKSGIDLNNPNHEGMTPLHFASQDDSRFQIAEKLLNSGVQIHAMLRDGKTPLHIACQSSSTKIVKLLLFHKCSVNEQTIFGQTALHIACERGNTNIIQCLIDAGADVSIKDRYLQTPIFYSVKKSRVEATKLLITSGADIFLNDIRGKSVLHVVIKTNNVELFDLIVENITPQHINRKDLNGKTPLRQAAYINNLFFIQTLINLGGDASLVDNDNLLALHHVFERRSRRSDDPNNWLKCFQLLLKSTPPHIVEKFGQLTSDMGDDRSLPCLLLEKKSYPGLSLLFDAGLSRNVISCPVEREKLYSPVSYLLIHRAFWMSDDELWKYFELLLSQDVLVDPRYTGHHVSPLEAAIEMHDSSHINCICLKVLNRLLEKGANPLQNTKNHIPPVFVLALRNRYLDAIKLFLKYFPHNPEDFVLMIIIMFKLARRDETPIMKFFLTCINSNGFEYLASFSNGYDYFEAMHIEYYQFLVLEILKLDTQLPSLKRIARIAIWRQMWKDNGRNFLKRLRLLDIPKSLVQFLTCFDYPDYADDH